MIWGRPTTLWLGLLTAIAGAISTTALVLGVDPVVVAQLSGAYLGIGGSVIALVAGQPPTLQTGDNYTIQTPKGQPNYEATVGRPPAAGPAPEPIVEDKP